MKTTIGVIHNLIRDKKQNSWLENIASEFFGAIAKEKVNKKSGIFWLTFPSKNAAKLFSDSINFPCVDADKKTFK